MTSSYRNPYAMGSTNYLSTEADLSKAVVAEQNNLIQDTSEFYNQMMELEKQRYEQQNKNLELFGELLQDAAPFAQQLRQANEDRIKYKPTLDSYKGAQSDINDELLNAQNNIEREEKLARNEELKFHENTKRESQDPTKTKEDRTTAADASAIFGQGSFTYQDSLNSRNDAKQFSKDIKGFFTTASKDERFGELDGMVLKDATTNDEVNSMLDVYESVIFQNYIRARRAKGLRELTPGEVRKYLAPQVYDAREQLKLEWKTGRDQLLEQAQKIRNQDEIGSMFLNKSTLANDVLGKEGWITNRKTQLEARGLETSEASQLAFQEFGELVEPMLDDVASGVDAADLRVLLDTEFEFPGGTMKMNDPRAPKGAQRLHATLTAAAIKYDEKSIERENEVNELRMGQWEDTNHVEFVEKLNKTGDPRQAADMVDEYVLNFRKEFNISDDESLPPFMKNFLASRQFADDTIVTEIRSRRRNNLPITQSMIDKIADPDVRDEQSQYVNTPELGAFTEEEAENMDERVVAIVKEAKQLRDLDKAKTDKYIVTRNNTKEYITERFKELVIGGQPRKVAMSNAIKEAKVFVKDGDFDKEEILPIDSQATKDLAATLNAVGADPSLIYSSEEWAGEAPHLAIAREYERSGGQTRYPSYYMRFNFIKNADGAYLTPEEIFKARIAKVDKKEESKEQLPERKELDNIDDQNKLLNKNNATKTLDVASKNNNIEWMIKTKPSVSGLNAEMFIRQLETNIQRQQFIGGISLPHKQKTTLSTEDNNKLFEAVPELKEAPFLNPNTLSPAAINAMLKLNI